LVVTYFAGDLSSLLPHTARSASALHRFRQIIQQVPDSELIQP